MTGTRLKELLLQKELKQSDVAKALGITNQSLYHMFANQDIKTGVLETICRTFEIDMNYFFPEFGASMEQVMPHEEYYKALIELKDERIRDLESQVALLKQKKNII